MAKYNACDFPCISQGLFERLLFYLEQENMVVPFVMSRQEAQRFNKKHEKKIPVHRRLPVDSMCPLLPETRFGTYMKDHSMLPRLKQGDLLMVNPKLKPQNEDIVLIFYQGEFLVRQYFGPQKGCLLLLSFSTNYESIKPAVNEVTICGVVKSHTQFL